MPQLPLPRTTFLLISQSLQALYFRCNLMTLRLMMLAPALFFPGMVRAQQSTADGMVSAVCGIIGPFILNPPKTADVG